MNNYDDQAYEALEREERYAASEAAADEWYCDYGDVRQLDLLAPVPEQLKLEVK